MDPKFILIKLPTNMAAKELEEEVARFMGHFYFPDAEQPLVLTDEHFIEVWHMDSMFGPGAHPLVSA